jgi:hypothetical protein
MCYKMAQNCLQINLQLIDSELPQAAYCPDEPAESFGTGRT